MTAAERHFDAQIGALLRAGQDLARKARRATRELGCADPVRTAGVMLRDIFRPDDRLPDVMADLIDELEANEGARP